MTTVQIKGPQEARINFQNEYGEDVFPGEFLLDEDDQVIPSELEKLRKCGFTSVRVHGIEVLSPPSYVVVDTHSHRCG